MSGYGYGYRSGYSAYNGAPTRANEWREASYASDHICRPVIVDVEGRKMPVTVSIPKQYGQSYVAKVETVVEHVRVPVFPQYRNSSPPKFEPMKDYGYRYGSPPKFEPVKDYGYRYGSPPKFEPVKDYGYRYGSPPKDEPVKDYGYRYGSPPKVEPVKIYGRVNPPSKVEPMRDYGYKHSPLPRPVEPVNDSRYRYSSPPKVEPERDYGYNYSSEPRVRPVNDFGYRYSSPPKVEPMRNVYGYKPTSLPKVEPMKDYGYRNNSPPKVEPEKDYGSKMEARDQLNNGSDKRRPSIPAEDRPPEVEDFLAKVQTEASRPRFPINAANWRQLAPPANANNGDNNKDDYNRKNEIATEPTTVTTGGWARPSRSAWRAAPATREGTLGKPTSDIAEAVENLKEAVTGLSVASGPPQSWRNPVPFSTEPKRDAYTETIDSREAARRYGKDAYTETIDSREAARRYGNLNGSSRPEKAGGQTFTATIDSREAAKKYGGASID